MQAAFTRARNIRSRLQSDYRISTYDVQTNFQHWGDKLRDEIDKPPKDYIFHIDSHDSFNTTDSEKQTWVAVRLTMRERRGICWQRLERRRINPRHDITDRNTRKRVRENTEDDHEPPLKLSKGQLNEIRHQRKKLHKEKESKFMIFLSRRLQTNISTFVKLRTHTCVFRAPQSLGVVVQWERAMETSLLLVIMIRNRNWLNQLKQNTLKDAQVFLKNRRRKASGCFYCWNC